MADWCETCGQELPHESVDPAEDHGVLLEPPGAEKQASPFARPDRTDGRSSSGTEKRLLFGLLAVVLAWAAFVGIGRLTAPDAAIDEQAAAPQPNVAAAPTPEPEPTPCLLYTSPSPRDATLSRMPSSA